MKELTLYREIYEFYQMLIKKYSEEEIYLEMITFIKEGLDLKEQYKNKNTKDLINLYYELIELKKVE
jgi:hypothetical protein